VVGVLVTAQQTDPDTVIRMVRIAAKTIRIG